MKRDIEFRVWTEGGFERVEDLGLWNQEDLEQYIGLRDKNGTKIFECDFVQLFGDSDEVFEVVYDDYHDAKTPSFVLEAEHGYGAWFSDKDREVVGNIHEGILKDNSFIEPTKGSDNS